MNGTRKAFHYLHFARFLIKAAILAAGIYFLMNILGINVFADELRDGAAYTINTSFGISRSAGVSSDSEGTGVSALSVTGEKSQQWMAAYVSSDDTWLLINSESGYALEASGFGFPFSGTALRQGVLTQSDSQKWCAVKNDDGTWSFVNIGTGKALDVRYAGAGSGSEIWLYPRNDTKAQRFVLTQVDGQAGASSDTSASVSSGIPYAANSDLLSSSSSASLSYDDALSEKVFAKLNEFRVQNGKTAFTESKDGCAKVISAIQAGSNAYHYSWGTDLHFVSKHGYGIGVAGTTWNVTADKIISLWVNSKGHKADILNEGKNSVVGISVAYYGDAQGHRWFSCIASFSNTSTDKMYMGDDEVLADGLNGVSASEWQMYLSMEGLTWGRSAQAGSSGNSTDGKATESSTEKTKESNDSTADTPDSSSAGTDSKASGVSSPTASDSTAQSASDTQSKTSSQDTQSKTEDARPQDTQSKIEDTQSKTEDTPAAPESTPTASTPAESTASGNTASGSIPSGTGSDASPSESQDTPAEPTMTYRDDIADQVFSILNQFRTENGKSEFTKSTSTVKAVSVIQSGSNCEKFVYGATPLTELAQHRYCVGAGGYGIPDAQKIVDAWKASTPHRANILGELDGTCASVSIAVGTNADGKTYFSCICAFGNTGTEQSFYGDDEVMSESLKNVDSDRWDYYLGLDGMSW